MQRVGCEGPVALLACEAELEVARLHRHGHQVAEAGPVRRWRIAGRSGALCMGHDRKARGDKARDE